MVDRLIITASGVEFDAGRGKFTVIRHAMDDKLINVTSQENSPLEIGTGPCKTPANVLQTFHEANNDQSINVSKPGGCPKAVEVVKQETDYALKSQIA